MKKTNKGFSLVELIIVIAIMAILAGALAPALIKYINKSRISTDIQTANSIATAIQSALANESAYDGAAGFFTAGTPVTIQDIYDEQPAAGTTNPTDLQQFAAQVVSTLGTNVPTVKSKKCMAADATDYVNQGTANFAVDVNLQANTIIVTEDGQDHQLYPTAATCLTDEVASCTPTPTNNNNNGGGNGGS